MIDSAGSLPFAAGEVTRLILRHITRHVPDVEAVVLEAARVLQPGGILHVTERLAPDETRKQGSQAAGWLNAFLRLHDRDHVSCLSKSRWRMLFYQAGFTLVADESARRELVFDEWAASSDLSSADRLRLRAMLLQTPEPLAAFLTPAIRADRITFSLVEAQFVARKIVNRVV